MAAYLKSQKNVKETGSKSSSSALAREIFNEFALEGLDVHNTYRKKHGVPDLQLTVSMCKLASDWAKNLAQKDILISRQDIKLGQNLYEIDTDDHSFVPEATIPINAWYNEITQFKFGTEGGGNDTRHFTQMIWKSSTDLGFAMAKNKKGKVFIAAFYRPPGNIAGEFVKNVPKNIK